MATRVPEMNALFHEEELVDALAEAFPEGLRLAKGTQGRALKLQRNAGVCRRSCSVSRVSLWPLHGEYDPERVFNIFLLNRAQNVAHSGHRSVQKTLVRSDRCFDESSSPIDHLVDSCVLCGVDVVVLLFSFCSHISVCHALPHLFFLPSKRVHVVSPTTPPSGSGGCFPLHYDNPGPPNKRALTCLLYLNPDWKDGDGGELCLTPFLQKERVIAPLLDRMVRESE